MDIDKLIERLWNYSVYNNALSNLRTIRDAATALSTLQTENEKLRDELEQVKRERDAAIRDLEMVSVCDTCVHEHAPSCPGCNDAENWEWRGPEEG